MGELEKEARRERRVGYIQQSILMAIALTGFLAVVAVAPNVIQVLGGVSRKRSARFRHQIKTALSRLAYTGHITFQKQNGKRYARITEKGKRALELERMRARRGKKPGRWDKRYRVIVFDIPERIKNKRNQLRQELMEFGFYCLQDSVWVYPYDCEDLTTLIKAELELGGSVIYMIVEKIENDKYIREHFKLNKRKLLF
jgi:CRISPR-associated endonuclease Cas2